MKAPKDPGKVKPPNPAPQPPGHAFETGGAPTTAESGGNIDDGPSQDSLAGEAQHMSEGPDDDMEGPGLEESKASVVDSPTADADVKIETKPSVHQPNASNGTKQHRAATQMRDAAAKPAPGLARADKTDVQPYEMFDAVVATASYFVSVAHSLLMKCFPEELPRLPWEKNDWRFVPHCA